MRMLICWMNAPKILERERDETTGDGKTGRRNTGKKWDEVDLAAL